MTEHAIEVNPVIDLKGGAVVRARHGSRHSYAPIVTPAARTSAPLDVVAGFLTIHPFRTTYAADLDRIASRGSHEQSLDALTAAFPDVAFWVDAGLRERRRGTVVARSPQARASRSWKRIPGWSRGARRTRHGRPHRFITRLSRQQPSRAKKAFAMRRICGPRA